MAIPDAAFWAVRFCSYTVRRICAVRSAFLVTATRLVQYSSSQASSQLAVNKEVEEEEEEEKKNKKRSSATAEKQRVICACLPIGWLTDRAMHRTPQNRRGCILFLTFKRSDSRSAGRKRILS